ncbi:MAG: ATP-binding protein [Acidimicrobiia bacterium]
MTSRFVGRQRELGRLEGWLTKVRQSGNGRLLALRGRRQVGKSTLVEQFVQQSGTAHVFFTAAAGQAPAAALADFGQLVARSTLAGRDVAASGTMSAWDQALDSATAGQLDPVIVVLDEVPWLIESDPSFEGLLQRVWDRALRSRPVLLILIGSDLAMMEALSAHGRPLYDRAELLRVDPLDPSDVAEITGTVGRDSIEASVLTGGFPNLLRSWPHGGGARSFLREQLADHETRFIIAGERKLAAEFPSTAFARPVLDAIGSGYREHSKIATRTGLAPSSLERAVGILIDKRAISKDSAYSTARSKATLYRVADSHLQVWLRYVAPNLAAIERGAGDAVISRVLDDWTAWRGRLIEPLVRESVLRLAVREAGGALTRAEHVGAWWRRDFSTEVDLVIGDKSPVANRVLAVGSIKWRERKPFDGHELAVLERSRVLVPGADDALMVAVSTSGFAPGLGLHRAWSPADLVAAWT